MTFSKKKTTAYRGKATVMLGMLAVFCLFLGTSIEVSAGPVPLSEGGSLTAAQLNNSIPASFGAVVASPTLTWSPTLPPGLSITEVVKKTASGTGLDFIFTATANKFNGAFPILGTVTLNGYAGFYAAPFNLAVFGNSTYLATTGAVTSSPPGTGDSITFDFGNASNGGQRVETTPVVFGVEVQDVSNTTDTGSTTVKVYPDTQFSATSNNLVGPVAPTPEPSTLVLACLAGVPFAVAGFRRWRSKDATQKPLTV